MNSDTMDLTQLAKYLRRDLREITKLAGKGQLPGLPPEIAAQVGGGQPARPRRGKRKRARR